MEITYEWIKERLRYKVELAKKQWEDSNEREKSYYAGRYRALDQFLDEIHKREISRY